MNDIDITKRSERVNIFYLRRFTKEIHFYVARFVREGSTLLLTSPHQALLSSMVIRPGRRGSPAASFARGLAQAFHFLQTPEKPGFPRLL